MVSFRNALTQLDEINKGNTKGVKIIEVESLRIKEYGSKRRKKKDYIEKY